MSTTTCACCRGPRCVRVRPLDEISFEAALRRLRDELTGAPRPGVHPAPVPHPPLPRPPVPRPPVPRPMVYRPTVHRPPATYPPLDRWPVDRPLSNDAPVNPPPANGAPDVLPRPWEMTHRQFEAAAEPSVQTAWGGVRFRGLSRSLLRREIEFLLRCPGGPVDGYGVRVPAGRADLFDQPHRAFVEAALADGLAVPSQVLDDYPELRQGQPAGDVSDAGTPRLTA